MYFGLCVWPMVLFIRITPLSSVLWACIQERFYIEDLLPPK